MARLINSSDTLWFSLDYINGQLFIGLYSTRDDSFYLSVGDTKLFIDEFLDFYDNEMRIFMFYPDEYGIIIRYNYVNNSSDIRFYKDDLLFQHISLNMEGAISIAEYLRILKEESLINGTPN